MGYGKNLFQNVGLSRADLSANSMHCKYDMLTLSAIFFRTPHA